MVKRTQLKSYFILGFTLLFISLQVALGISNADGLSPAQLQALNEGILYFDTDSTSSCTDSSDTTTVSLVGGDNEQEAYNFFLSHGLNAIQSASIVGNLMRESGMNPTASQSGVITNDPSSLTTITSGWGIAQWTPGDKILQEAQQYNITTPIYELGTQLDIEWNELRNTSLNPAVPNTIADLDTATTVQQGVLDVLQDFEEGPWQAANFPSLAAYEAGTAYSDRVNFANQAIQLYGGSENNSGSTNDNSLVSSCGQISTSNCNNSTSASTNSSPTNNTATRQTVICLAEQELHTWESQPGYPNTNYAETGYLKYTQGSAEEWCADFASWIYNQAGDPFSGGASGWRLPGVPDIVSLGEQNKQFTWHPADKGYVPSPGDLAIYTSSEFQFAHVNIFISSSGGVSNYIGGDQGHGPYPGGSIVSEVQGSGYYSNGIVGYVSPN